MGLFATILAILFAIFSTGATAQAIPGAELILVKGMGHDMPAEHYETIADGVRRTADRARSPEKQGDADPAR